MPFWLLVFNQIFFIVAGKEENHYISDEYNFRPDSTGTEKLAALERLKKNPIDL